MKIVIPVAGGGTRLKPHTLSTPKQLLKVAGIPILDYIIAKCIELEPSQIIFVVGHHKEQIVAHIEHSNISVPYVFVEQKVRNGDGAAVHLALKRVLENEDEELFILFADSLIDFKSKEMIEHSKKYTGSIACQRVEKPSEYGVVQLNKSGKVIGIEEKPSHPKSDLAIIGAYYFTSFKLIYSMLDRYIKEKITLKGEYRVAQVIMELAKSEKYSLNVYEVSKWFDCGRPSVLLGANRYFLDTMKKSKGDRSRKDTRTKIIRDNEKLSCEKLSSSSVIENSVIVPPCYISKYANIKNSIIGPYSSIEADCVIEGSHITNSIIGAGTKVKDVLLQDSLISHNALIKGKRRKVNIGEKCEVEFD